MMDLSICSIKRNISIAPQHFELWHTEEDQFIFVEPLDPITLEWNRKKQTLSKGCIAIGRKYRISNHSSKMVTIRGLVIKSATSRKYDSLIIEEKNERNEQILNDICSIFIENSSLSPELLHKTTGYLSQLIDLINAGKGNAARIPNADLSGKVDTRLIKINRYIRKYYYEPITLMELANLIHCNPVYLSNMYSKVFQVSPMKHIQRIRMKKASYWLIQSTKSIKEIASDLGYISTSQFCSLFKNYYNMSPVEYRSHSREVDF